MCLTPAVVRLSVQVVENRLVSIVDSWSPLLLRREPTDRKHRPVTRPQGGFASPNQLSPSPAMLRWTRRWSSLLWARAPWSAATTLWYRKLLIISHVFCMIQKLDKTRLLIPGSVNNVLTAILSYHVGCVLRIGLATSNRNLDGSVVFFGQGVGNDLLNEELANVAEPRNKTAWICDVQWWDKPWSGSQSRFLLHR